jgi:hypothetical protein
MSAPVRASLVICGGLGVALAARAQAAEATSFEDAAKNAAAAPAIDALVAPYLDDCSKARREIDRVRCRGMQTFVQEKLPQRLYTTVIDSPNVVSVSGYDAGIKGFRIRLVGCLTCEKPVLGPSAQKRFVTLKVPDQHAASFGAASWLADSTVSFDSLPEARTWEATVKPQLRAEFVFKPTGRQWSYREHKGVAFAPVATRIFNRCTGEVIFSSPRSLAKVPVEEDVPGCKPAGAASASRSEKDGLERTDKEGLDQRPEKLGAAEIAQAIKPARDELEACDAKHRTRGRVDLEFVVPGQGGTAQSVRARGQLVGTEVAKCLEDAVRKVQFPEFQRASQTFSFAIPLQGE